MSGSEIRHSSSGEAGKWQDTDADGQGNNAALDNDGDGISNYQEYLEGSLPLDDTSCNQPQLGRLG